MSHHRKIVPIENPIPAKRQQAKRHYGVHPYFTRRPYNVVREYILHFSEEGDSIVDPFGGSGVTAIEAFLENRIAVHNDINPLANFIAQGIADLSKGKVSSYKRALATLEASCKDRLTEIVDANQECLHRIRRSLILPENVRLPSNSDVTYYHELFTTQQFVSLALLKHEIDDINNSSENAI